MDRGGTKLLVISAISTVAVTAGAVTFFVAHPEGKRMFSNFLDAAAGKTPTEEPAPDEPVPTVKNPEDYNPEAIAFYEKAKEAVKSNDLDAAEEALRAALAKEPDFAEAKALLDTIPALRTQAAEAEKNLKHDTALDTARQFLADEDLDKAETWGKKALEHLPDSPKALAFLNDVARARERRVRDEAARRARADDIAREGTQALAAGDYDRALQLADQALKLDPDNAAATLLKTQIEMAKKKAAEEELAAKTEEARRLADEAERKRKEAEAAAAAAAKKKEEDALKPITLDGYDNNEPDVISIDIDRQPDVISIDVDKKDDDNVVTVATGAAHTGLTPETQAMIIALDRMDKALERKNASAYGRVLSDNYLGVETADGRMSRDAEVANARSFFGKFSNIDVTRTTKEADLKATDKEGEVRSSHRINFELDGVKLSRSYTVLYRFAREGEAWKIVSMSVEEEGQ